MKFNIGVEPNDFQKNPAWQNARTIRLNIDNHTCQCCGAKRNLQVHHMTREANDNPDPYMDLITLCNNCHGRIEKSIKEQQFPSGEVNFTIVGAETNMFQGSDKMEPCFRLKIKLLISANNMFVRYIHDNLPFLDSFIWKWTEFKNSVGLEQNIIDTETIINDVIGLKGRAMLTVREGDKGNFSCVEHYIKKLSTEEIMFK